jgi:hypothetical protein
MLRDFATQVLGAQRCSSNYLAALRHVLGNQAYADRIGCLLVMNRGVRFATERTMRTLIEQFCRAGITFKQRRQTSASHSEVMAFYQGADVPRHENPEEEYERVLRCQEGEDWRRMVVFPVSELPAILPEEVPH